MKKAIKHCWKYLTTPSYRRMIDLLACSKAYNDAWNAMQDNALLSNYPRTILNPLEFDAGLSFNMYDAGFKINKIEYKDIPLKSPSA